MKLQLAKKKLFEGFEIECYEDVSKENGDFFMTIDQVAQALEVDRKNIEKNIERKREKVGKPITVNLSVVEGNREVSRNRTLYTFEQFFEIIDGSRQPKAFIFRQWVLTTLKELLTGRAELKFHKEEDKIVYEEKITQLSKEFQEVKSTLKTFIDYSTINSRQAQKINKLGRQTIINQLGGTKSDLYKAHSRTCFKRFWNCFNDTFEITSYHDIRVNQFEQAIIFCENFILPKDWLI